MSEVRHGTTLQAYRRQVRALLKKRELCLGCMRPEPPLWDYWSSGYSAEAAAEDIAADFETDDDPPFDGSTTWSIS